LHVIPPEMVWFPAFHPIAFGACNGNVGRLVSRLRDLVIASGKRGRGRSRYTPRPALHSTRSP
jgi:hypothetical protein